MKIQFKELTWVLKQEGGGFGGHYVTKAAQIKPEPFEVRSIERDKKKGISRIHVWSDGCADGENVFLINVPNKLFEEI